MTLGFVVLARRPDSVEPVSAVFTGPKALEQAQNVLESRKSRKIGVPGFPISEELDGDPVEYVIGEITAVVQR